MQITLDLSPETISQLVAPILDEPRILLHSVTWEQYETMITAVGDRPRLRLSYLDRMLEIMTISPEHEMLKKMIARLVEIYALEADIPLYSCGSATFRQQAVQRGLEPDESYCFNRRKDFPDLAIEVVITSGTLDKLEIYRGLGVAEVWVWQNGQMTVHQLRADGSGDDPFAASQLLPGLDLELLGTYIKPDTEPQALRAFRNRIRPVN